MDLQAPDRAGLLYLVADFFTENGIQVLSARVTTEKGAALDTFYLCLDTERRLEKETYRVGLARKLQKLLES